MNFGEAVEALKDGKLVTRKGWNGKGMYLWLLPAATVKTEWCKDNHLKKLAEKNGGEIECLSSVRMKTADNKVVTGWVASQVDMVADDWMLYSDESYNFELPTDDWNYRGVRILQAYVPPIGWDDATVNGVVDDEKNPKIPCVETNNHGYKVWNIYIDIKNGQVLNWIKGVTAKIYYKIVDMGVYTAYNNLMCEVYKREGYVPEIFDFADEDGNYGYGDYMGFTISKDGHIIEWPTGEELEEFIDDFLD